MNLKNNKEEVNSNAETEQKKEFAKPKSSGMEAPIPELKVKKSPQLAYVSQAKHTPGLRKKSYEKHSLMYKWSKKANCWNRYFEKDAESNAFRWLSENSPQAADDKKAKSCVVCLKYELQEVPEEPTDTIIPLNNVWLKVNAEAKQIEYLEPTEEIFIDYTINTEIPVTHGSKVYQPKDLPEGSLFKKYIESSLPNAEKRALVQEYCGYTLMKGNPYQVAQFWEGMGSDGKSVLMKIMQKLHKNHKTMDLDNLTPTELNKLIGASLVVVPETPENNIDEQIFKKCASSDIISVRALYENSVDYMPMAKWIVSCNKFPHIKDTSDGFWRRVQLIRWENQFKGDAIIFDLEKRIINEELHFVLDWALQGILRLIERGKFDDRSIVDEKEKKQIQNNSVLLFINQSGLELSNDTNKSSFAMKKDDVYRRYQEFCENNGFIYGNSTKFWLTVATRIKGIQENRKRCGNERKFFVNLRFNISDDVDAQKEEQRNQVHAKVKLEAAQKPLSAPIATSVKPTTTKAPESVKEPNPHTSWTLDGKDYHLKFAYEKALKDKGIEKPQPSFGAGPRMDELLAVLRKESSTEQERAQAQEEILAIAYEQHSFG
jgi:putative DNA primase/helicase